MVSHLFIEGVLLDGQRTNVIVTDNIITGIGSELPMPVGSTYIDGSQYAAFPSFANMHTHAPMTLLRGLGDDTPLDEWLHKWIWPTEQRLNPDSIYWGTRLACLEMIKSGTTAFNDMYFFLPEMAKAVTDSGIRAQLGL
ncbi:MAG: amidohydrolase family protein, partial [Bacteroidales bacterium]|nr:amidohydrolase family protein [Bacteroidales bacterium]